MVLSEPTRFDRLVEGWGPENQAKVGNACISIILDGPLGKYTASYPITAGFGNFRLVGNSPLQEQYLWGQQLQGDSQVAAYASAFRKLSPGVRIQTLTTKMNNVFIRDQLRRSDVIIDATNDPASKAWTLDTAMLYHLPAISASCNIKGGRIRSFSPKRDQRTFQDLDHKMDFQMHEYTQTGQEELVAMALAGLVSEEAKKFILSEKTREESLVYEAPPRLPKGKFANLRALVIGTGASGHKAIPALAMLGFGSITMVDYDNIELTNLPRTEYFAGITDRQKVTTLKEILEPIFPKTEFQAFDQKFDRDFPNTDYDIIVGCVDQDSSRGEIYAFAIANQLPHLSIGTSFDGFNSALAVPHKTACIKHYFPGFEEQVAHSTALIRASCERTEASNSWMQAGAVFGVLELPKVFFPELAGEPFNGYLYCTANPTTRLTEITAQEICNCWGEKQ